MKTTRALIWLLTLALPALVLLALPISTARAADPVILRVKTSGTTTWPCGDASDWSNACALQTALTRSVSGSEVWVAAGTYTPTAGADRFATFQLKSGVALYGGFVGGETLRQQRNLTTNVTILSGDIGTQGEDSDNSYHVVVGSGVTNTAVLDGFTVTGGTAYGIQDRGGGMYNNAGSPTLANVIFISNTASAYGGGMWNESNSSPTLTNVTFSSNSASDSGGGIYNDDSSSPTLTSVTFSGNSAQNGGGILNYAGSPTLTNVTFSGNSANSNGGGIYNYDISSNSTLTNVTFSDNSALYGGGMDNNGSATLTNVTFASNSAGEGGGGISNSGSVTLTNVTFASNTAGQWGGGMENVGSATLTNVAFTGNSADSGGGMDTSTSNLTNVTFAGNTAHSYAGGLSNYGSSTLTNVTFAGNTVNDYGGGIYSDPAGSLTIRNAILWSNAAAHGSQIYDASTTLSMSDSVVQGGYAGGTNILTTDPHLGPLGNWGGATQTIPVLPGSSAIDAGNSTTCATTPTDQRGKPRVGTCDIGAFEFQGYALTNNHGDHQSTLINTPFANSLEVTLTETGSAVLLPGGVVTFTAPSSGASAAWSGSLTQTATANASGAATVAAPTANGTAGSFTVTANVSGTTALTTLTLTNAPADTTTVITASANPVLAGQPLTLTVTVSPVSPSSGTPTGSIDLYETSSPALDVRGTRRSLASQPLVNGIATFTVPSLTRGAHTLLAVYGGDGNYKASTSAIHIQNAFLLDYYLPLIRR